MTFLRCIALPFLLTTLLALSAPAAEEGEPNPAADASASSIPAGSDLPLSRFPAVFGQNLTSNLFHRDNLAPFMVGSIGALVIAPLDEEISRSLNSYAKEYGDTGDIVGQTVPVAFAAGMFVASRFTENDRFRAFGYTLAQAYVTTKTITYGLKWTTHRMRPDNSGSTSFPSGHTADTFAMATVVSHYYGKKWGIPLYAVGILVGASRVERKKHWPSDVIAGAALGYITGKTAIRGTNRELSRNKKSKLVVSPVFGRDVRGVSATIIF